MVGRLNHMSKAQVRERSPQLLEQFGLTEAANRPVKTTPAACAGALTSRHPWSPAREFSFLDEPTTGLDPASRADVWTMIEGLVAEGTTVLLTTQYLEEADRLAEQLVVVDRGKVIASGTPATLKAEMGATVLDLGLLDEETALRAGAALEAVNDKPPVIVGRTVEVNVNDGPRVVTEALRIETKGIVPITLALREPESRRRLPALTGQRTEVEPVPNAEGVARLGSTAFKQKENPRVMTTATIPVPNSPVGAEPASGHRLRWAISDTLTITKRNLIGYTRVPEAVFFSSVQPIMFVLLFRYVFGGAIPTPGYHYVQFLMPGIFVQTVAFGSIGTSIGLAEDLQKGLIERFRALPDVALGGPRRPDDRGPVPEPVRDGPHDRSRLRRGLSNRDQRRRVPRRNPASVALLLCAQLGLRLHRAVGGQQRDGTADVLPTAVPAHVRILGVRAAAVDAGVVASVRQTPTGVHRGQRCSRPDVRVP